MSETRDPRVDPKPGDVLDVGDQRETVRTTKARHYRNIRCIPSYRMKPGSMVFCGIVGATYDSFTLAEFRVWAKNAEVIHRAD